MTARLTDRDMLTRTLHMIDNGPCCDFFACPGPNARPVPMASCSKASAAYELRQYMRRNGGWCPEHGQELSQCHKTGPNDIGWSPDHDRRSGGICYCAPVNRTKE